MPNPLACLILRSKMSNKIKTVRIAPGYYNVKIGGITYEITKVDGEPNWFWAVDGATPDDWYSSKAEAIQALATFLKL